MAKRRKNAEPKKSAAPKKIATPEKPKSDVPSAVKVNPMYDEMPDEVSDPGAVFKLAFLDMHRQEIINRLAVVVQEFEKRTVALARDRNTAIETVKAELREAEQKLKAHKDTIEAQYGLALKSYTYDDETGVLKKQAILEAEAEEQPSAASPEEKAKTLN